LSSSWRLFRIFWDSAAEALWRGSWCFKKERKDSSSGDSGCRGAGGVEKTAESKAGSSSKGLFTGLELGVPGVELVAEAVVCLRASFMLQDICVKNPDRCVPSSFFRIGYPGRPHDITWVPARATSVALCQLGTGCCFELSGMDHPT